MSKIYLGVISFQKLRRPETHIVKQKQKHVDKWEKREKKQLISSLQAINLNFKALHKFQFLKHLRFKFQIRRSKNNYKLKFD